MSKAKGANGRRRRHYSYSFTATLEQVERLRSMPNSSEWLRRLVAEGLAELDGEHIKKMKEELEVAFLKGRLMGGGAEDLLEREGVSNVAEFWKRSINPLQEKIREAEQKLERAKEEEAKRRREEKEKAKAAKFF